jgi:hypothetical protein
MSQKEKARIGNSIKELYSTEGKYRIDIIDDCLWHRVVPSNSSNGYQPIRILLSEKEIYFIHAVKPALSTVEGQRLSFISLYESESYLARSVTKLIYGHCSIKDVIYGAGIKTPTVQLSRSCISALFLNKGDAHKAGLRANISSLFENGFTDKKIEVPTSSPMDDERKTLPSYCGSRRTVMYRDRMKKN